MVGLGLLITIIALGEKGFRTLGLKLIGPSLVGCGGDFCSAENIAWDNGAILCGQL